MADTIHQLRVTLKNTRPPIWRRLHVPSDFTLGDLHYVIQIAMGWGNEHLHEFSLKVKDPQVDLQGLWQGGLSRDDWTRLLDQPSIEVYGRLCFGPVTDGLGDLIAVEWEDEDMVTLAMVCPKEKTELLYTYDFGDSWEHTVATQRILEPKEGVVYPVSVAGKLACPPEDSGGVWGYYDLLEARKDPEHARHEDCACWLGDDFDPERFDIEESNRMQREFWPQA